MTTPDPHAWGLATRRVGADRRRRAVPAATVRALLAALGADAAGPGTEEGSPIVVVQGERPPISSQGSGTPVTRAEVELEDGGSRPCGSRLPADLPLGYHRLHREGASRQVIVTPPRCHLPSGRPGFGFAVQLYSVRSAESWGIGDLADLADLGRWAGGLGAATLLVNPLHATLPLPPVEPSPYFPASRLFLDPLCLRPDPGVGDAGIAELAAAARRLNRDRRIDRDRIAALKLAALERQFRARPLRGGVEARLSAHPRLGDFALFCALAERHGKDWREWPRPLARRDPAAIRAAAAELAERVRFHAWVQIGLARQLEDACAALPLIRDLAIGVHPGGADAWIWQELIAPGVTVGAPPDTFNVLGQDWGIPAFDPWKLRAAGYGPFIETVRANLHRGGGLRIDHVMGLSRLWWIPAGCGPADGAYVGYPLDDLLGIVALESARHQAIVVGEDLGTVPLGLRGRLRRRGLLSYVLLLFERRPPRRWPVQALAAVTTHDLPTIAGLWDGSDLEARRRLGLPADAATAEAMVAQLVGDRGPGRDAGVADAVLHAHRRIAESGCALVTATLEDIAMVGQRPNQPGSGVGGPSWSIGLPVSREQLQELPMARELAGVLARNGTERPGVAPSQRTVQGAEDCPDGVI